MQPSHIIVIVIVMRLATQLHPWSCCPAKYHTALNMQLLPCRMPHSFKHAAVAMQNATQLHTCSCCHAVCHTASNMQLLPCRMPHTVQLILNLIHACGYTRASTRFTRVKVYNMACIFLVARGFVVRTCAIKHSWHTRHAPHEQTRHKRTFS